MGARHKAAGRSGIRSGIRPAIRSGICLGLAAVLWTGISGHGGDYGDSGVHLGLGLGLGPTKAQAQSQAQPQSRDPQSRDPQARLEAARRLLMEQALEAPARIEATSWIDEGGRLREAARITSRFNVPRGFLRESLAQQAPQPPQAPHGSPQEASQEASQSSPQARSPQTSAASQASEALAETSTALCRGPGGLRRLALLSFEPPRVGDPADAPFAHGMIQGLEAALLAQAAADSAWAVQSRSTPVDAYERLLGLAGSEGAPYRLRVAFKLDPIDPRAGVRDAVGLDRVVGWADEQWQRAVSLRIHERPGQRVTISLEAFEPATGERLFVQERQFIAPSRPVSYGLPSLPAELQGGLQALGRAMWSDLAAAFVCRPLQFAAMPAADGRLTLPVGARAGLRVGDQLFVSDRARVPSRVLEAGTLERTALFEVVRLGEDQAVLTQMAGPKLERGVPWVAMPL